MSDILRVAAVQMSSNDRPSQNLKKAEELCRTAASRDAKLIVLPEYFLYRGPREGLPLVAREAAPVAAARMAELARELGCWLVASGLPIPSPRGKKLFNTTLVISPEGKVACRYLKMHLFNPAIPGLDVASESNDYLAGNEAGMVHCAGRKFGVAVCYDLRFPELFRFLTANNCLACILPADFTYHTGKAHWEILIRCRAIENQMFVIAAAQSGAKPGGAKSFGYSAIIGPWGEILDAIGEDEAGVITADLDFAYLRRVRQELPVLSHRRSWRWMRGRV